MAYIRNVRIQLADDLTRWTDEHRRVHRSSQDDAHHEQTAEIISVGRKYCRGIGKECGRFHILVETVVLFITQQADHLIPISSTGIADTLAARIFRRPEVIL